MDFRGLSREGRPEKTVAKGCSGTYLDLYFLKELGSPDGLASVLEAVSFVTWTRAFLKTADVEIDFGFLSTASWNGCFFAIASWMMQL